METVKGKFGEVAMLCPACGVQNPVGASACTRCQAPLSPTDEAMRAPGDLPGMPASPSRSDPLAGLGDRLLAVVLDTIFLGGAFAVAGMWSAARWGGATASGFEVTGKAALVTIGGVAAFGFIYYWFLEAAFCATLGKAMVGIQVRRIDGRRCTVWASLVRNLLRVIDALALYVVGLLVAIFSRLRQRIGDHAAQTIVVDRPVGAFLRTVAVIVWLAGIGGGIYAAIVIHRSMPAGAFAAQAESTAPKRILDAGSGPVGTLVSGDFKIRNLVWLQSKDGAERPPGPYKRGDDVFIRYDLFGYGRNAEGRVDIKLIMAPLDPFGVALDTPTETSLEQAVGDGVPINGSFHFHLPPFVPGGTYAFVVKVEDAVKKASAEFRQPFTVKAEPIKPASKIEVRDFEYAGEEGGPALERAEYGTGKTVHYRFDLFGLGFAGDNAKVRVAYQLLSPRGKVLLEKPDWATVADTFAYHPATFFLTFTGHVTLPEGVDTGTYVQRYTITDEIARKSTDYESKFQVR